MSESSLRFGLIFFGVINLVTGVWQLFAPGSFFDEIGPYGLRNDHYLGDVGAFYVAAGVGLLLAVSRPGWREPLLWVAAIWYALHAANHLFDIGENNESDARGITDTVLLAIGAVALAYLARAASGPGAGDSARAAAEMQRPQPPPARRSDYPPGD